MDSTDSMKGQIFEAIPKVMADIGAVKKSKTNQQGFRYQYRGIDDFYNAAHGPLSKHGVFFTTTIVRCDPQRVTKDDKVMTAVDMLCNFNFYAKDGSCITTQAAGQAYDYSDKAMYKAMSMCLKYALVQLFCVPTDDIEDGDAESPQIQTKGTSKPPKKEQQQEPYDPIQDRNKLAKRASELFIKLGKTVKSVREQYIKEIFGKTPKDMTIMDWNNCIAMLHDELKAREAKPAQARQAKK